MSQPFRGLTELDGARDLPGPDQRRRELIARAGALRERLLDAPSVALYQSVDLYCGPYPSAYGFWQAPVRCGPYLYLSNRMFAVQFHDWEGARRTLLWNPTFWGPSAGLLATPYFARLAKSLGPLRPLVEPVISDAAHTVPQALARIGLSPHDVDYLAYDHLHVQDLRPWLGAGGLFPEARLLITTAEWATSRSLAPPQRDWFVAGGTDGVPEDRVIFLDRDVQLGPSLSIVRTPGHTEGNQSLVARTPEGLLVTSENGVAPECWAPRHSGLGGLRRYSKDTGMDVVLNGNTLEGALPQYLSMVVERTIAGPSQRDPRFPNIAASSELTRHRAYIGAAPTFAFGPIAHGSPSRTS